MADNKILGQCVCPICRTDKAEVRESTNRKAYINCGECVTLIRSSSGVGDRAMRSMAAGAPVPAAAPAADPAPAVEVKKTLPKKPGGLADVARMLGGGA